MTTPKKPTKKAPADAATANIAALFTRIEKQEEELQAQRAENEFLKDEKRALEDQKTALGAAIERMEEGQREEVAKLKKDLETTNLLKNSYEGSKREAEKELEQLHSLLDALPEALPRESDDPNNPYSKRKNSAMTRLASWLAKR